MRKEIFFKEELIYTGLQSSDAGNKFPYVIHNNGKYNDIFKLEDVLKHYIKLLYESR